MYSIGLNEERKRERIPNHNKFRFFEKSHIFPLTTNAKKKIYIYIYSESSLNSNY